MSGKDWKMNDFKKPAGKGILKSKVKQKSAENIQPANRVGSIKIYMPKQQEVEFRDEAAKNGMSASTWLLFKLNNAARQAPH